MSDSPVLDADEAVKRARAAIERELSNRGYDDYPADREIWEETLDDVAGAVLKALNYEEVSELAWQYEDLE